MLAWRANLDVQFGFVVVTYITDYLSKGDAGVTAALKKDLPETKGWNDFERLNYIKGSSLPTGKLVLLKLLID